MNNNNVLLSMKTWLVAEKIVDQVSSQKESIGLDGLFKSHYPLTKV